MARASHSSINDDDGEFEHVPASQRRAAHRCAAAALKPKNESQLDGLQYRARVKHRLFGAGTVAELAGAGKQAKVKIDFDDDKSVRKTLVIAQANLESDTD